MIGTAVTDMFPVEGSWEGDNADKGKIKFTRKLRQN